MADEETIELSLDSDTALVLFEVLHRKDLRADALVDLLFDELIADLESKIPQLFCENYKELVQEASDRLRRRVSL